MAEVLINLRIPSLTLKSSDDSPAKRIDNSELRFMKAMDLPAIPKAGAVLDLTASSASQPFGCTVKRTEWDERENKFVISCSYAKASMKEADYRALLGSSDWVSKPLLS